MGRFSSSQQIYNAESLTKAQFKKMFGSALRKKGYAVCGEDSAEISYTLIFSKDRKWVSVLNPEYQPGAENVLKDAESFAEALKTNVVSVGLVDSDFAELKLFDSSGKLADTLILGESYMDEPSPTGKKELWQPLLTEDGTWEQVTEIQNGSYIFAEDALESFAQLIGMDGEQIMLDNEDTDDSAMVIYFKKAGEKKLTLNAAFKLVFGTALEPLGFVKAKTKYPYYIRLVDNRFIEIIGLNKQSNNIFNIISGIATIYRSEIDLNCSPKMNANWMLGVSEFYKRAHKYDYDPDYRKTIMRFGFCQSENQEIIRSLEIALQAVKEWVLSAFDKIKSIDDVIDYLYMYYMPGLDIFGPDVEFYKHINDRDGLLCFELDDPYEIVERRLENSIQLTQYKIKHNIDGLAKSDYEEVFVRTKQNCDKIKSYLDRIINDKQLYAETMSEINQRKLRNIERLRSYGLTI